MASLTEYGFRKTRSKPATGKAQVKKDDTKEATNSDRRTDHLDERVPINADLAALRAFDLDYSYGPAIGIARLQRWERANQLGLNPDPKIKVLVEEHNGDPKYTESLWKDYDF